MLSDSLALLKVFSGLIILLLLGIYSHQHGQAEDEKTLKLIKECVMLPSICAGRPLVIRVKTKVWSPESVEVQVKAGGVYLTQYPIEISNLDGKQSAGRIIDILGSFDRDGQFIVVKQREDDWIQTTKYLVSLVGLGLCLWLFVRLYTLSPGCRLPIIPRHCRNNSA
ncbi:hypothetical protein N9444_00885 [Gammaproteobacteria bacterium]|nr:hypothetical protein [Gammaproteobacteria bacterium]